jgi:PhnB protein
MSKVSTYLNFQGQTEEAFNFYSQVFGHPVEGLARIGDMPPGEGSLSEEVLKMVMHVELEILGGHRIMATDMLASQGQKIVVGNNTTVNLELDDRGEADRLYALLSKGGSEGSGMLDQFWGYWGCCLDRFGIRWMFNVSSL